jgi:hypothetical protein
MIYFLENKTKKRCWATRTKGRHIVHGEPVNYRHGENGPI